MNGWSKMHIHFHWSPMLSTNPKDLDTSQNWTSNGDTIMWESKKEMNGKWRSKPTKDYLNQRSCFSDYAILLQHFRIWWTIHFPTWSHKDSWSSIWTIFLFMPKTKKIWNNIPNKSFNDYRRTICIANHKSANLRKNKPNIWEWLSVITQYRWIQWSSQESRTGQLQWQ